MIQTPIYKFKKRQLTDSPPNIEVGEDNWDEAERLFREQEEQIQNLSNGKANKSNAAFTGTMTLNGDNVATTEKKEISLLNAWVTSFAGYEPIVAKSGLVVAVNGTIRSGTLTQGTTLLTLGPEYRPSKNRHFYIHKTDNTQYQLVVRTNGNVDIDGTDWSSGNYVLDISFGI